MKTKPIRADQAHEGMAVAQIRTSGIDGRYRMRKRRGQWPTITSCEYWRNGEGGKPTVYVTLSDNRNASFPLDPSDELIVADEGR